MLFNLQQMIGSRVAAEDGEIGNVKGFYFDDRQWMVRYLLVGTVEEFQSRDIIISPVSVDRSDPASGIVPLTLTKEKIISSPEVRFSRPLPVMNELAVASHYGWPAYWEELPPPPVSYRTKSGGQTTAMAERTAPQLYDTRDFFTFRVMASDGEVGTLEDALADDALWHLRYFVVGTGIPPERQVLISPPWVSGINEPARELHVNLSQELIMNSPEYDPAAGVTPGLERALCEHYGLPANWC